MTRLQNEVWSHADGKQTYQSKPKSSEAARVHRRRSEGDLFCSNSDKLGRVQASHNDFQRWIMFYWNNVSIWLLVSHIVTHGSIRGKVWNLLSKLTKSVSFVFLQWLLPRLWLSEDGDKATEGQRQQTTFTLKLQLNYSRDYSITTDKLQLNYKSVPSWTETYL